MQDTGISPFRLCKVTHFYFIGSFAIQPFIVFKHDVDVARLERVLQEPNDKEVFCPYDEFFLLTACPSFCNLMQFSEVLLLPSSGTNLDEKDELLGFGMGKIIPYPISMPAQDRPYLPYLFPQTKLRVSPIFKITHIGT